MLLIHIIVRKPQRHFWRGGCFVSKFHNKISGCSFSKVILFLNKRSHYSLELRSITVPIISHGLCQHLYKQDSSITNNAICTLSKGKRCGDGDSGGPLVVNGQLVGVMSWNGVYNGKAVPDVFMNVAIPEYRNWILSNIPDFLHNPSNAESSHNLPGKKL